ncbi:Protein of unknown function [Variovorax sp. HW608]|uniref:DUF3300 domain-containing protein n=1 Tax=Variovorax sp. HW608 TaxID=1034889 RepID=UPI00081F92E6|nr:DUF3300 domain-containing protein [Variovorax sp. HW608]SCK50252.1 Protein of unknown function [Variovorax sp. HW608]
MRPSARRFTRLLVVLLCLCLPALAVAQQSAPASFSREQVDQMMAPIALYPDSLLSQVLMASTYPADVADAAKWSRSHPDQSGDAAARAVQNQPWDPSVQSLVAFPQVIQMMGEQPDWVQNLGDAFLASSKDVLDSAQRLRGKAQQQGSLKSNEQQHVIVEQEPQTQQSVIRIEPTNPEVVYVPTYDPSVVYGTWPYPAYPPYYYPPVGYYGAWYPGWYPGAALATGVAFGIGVAAVGALWGNCNWGGGNVNINANRYNSINTNRQIGANQGNWQHNAANRRGVPYRDQRSQQQFGRNVPGAENRADFRGRDNAGRNAERQRAQAALQQRGMDPAQGRQNLRNDPATRQRAQQAAGNLDRGGRAGDQAGLRAGDRAAGQTRAGDRGGQFAGGDRGGQFGAGNRSQGLERVQSRPSADNAFRGAGGAAQTRQQVDRGAASRQSMANYGGARSSANRSRPSASYGASRSSGGFSGGRSAGSSGAGRSGGFSGGGGGRGGGGGGGGGGRGGGGRR